MTAQAQRGVERLNNKRWSDRSGVAPFEVLGG